MHSISFYVIVPESLRYMESTMTFNNWESRLVTKAISKTLCPESEQKHSSRRKSMKQKDMAQGSVTIKKR